MEFHEHIPPYIHLQAGHHWAALWVPLPALNLKSGSEMNLNKPLSRLEKGTNNERGKSLRQCPTCVYASLFLGQISQNFIFFFFQVFCSTICSFFIVICHKLPKENDKTNLDKYNTEYSLLISEYVYELWRLCVTLKLRLYAFSEAPLVSVQ